MVKLGGDLLFRGFSLLRASSLFRCLSRLCWGTVPGHVCFTDASFPWPLSLVLSCLPLLDRKVSSLPPPHSQFFLFLDLYFISSSWLAKSLFYFVHLGNYPEDHCFGPHFLKLFLKDSKCLICVLSFSISWLRSLLCCLPDYLRFFSFSDLFLASFSACFR